MCRELLIYLQSSVELHEIEVASGTPAFQKHNQLRVNYHNNVPGHFSRFLAGTEFFGNSWLLSAFDLHQFSLGGSVLQS